MLNLKTGTICGRSISREATPDERTWLLSQLNHRKSRVRWVAASELGRYQIREAVDALVIALRDEHWLVRLHTAKALGRIGDKKALAPLKEALQDDCPYVRRRVIVALGVLGNESIIPLVLKAVQADEQMWRYVSDALSHFMGPYAAFALIKVARGEKGCGASPSFMYAVGVTPLLLCLLKFSWGNLSVAMIKALGSYGDERASKELEWIVAYSPDRSIWQHAYQALGKIQYRKFEKYLPDQITD